MKLQWYRPCTDVGRDIRVEYDNDVYVFRHLLEALEFIGEQLQDRDPACVKSRGKLIVKVTK